MKPARPVLRYHGGKFRLREWVISHFPPHNVYVEPFGGGASVLLAKDPVRIEVYNDANESVVNLFRILRDPAQADALRAQLLLTPFSRIEHRRSWELTADPLESARRLIVRSFQSIGAKGDDERNGWRTKTGNGHNGSPVATWRGYADALEAFTARLNDVIIECADYRKILDIYDRPNVLFYLDPPYPLTTRKAGHRKTYGVHEMTDADHEELCRRLLTVEGFVVLSSYPNPIYDEILEGWKMVTVGARAQCNSQRVEALYLSPRTVGAIQMPLLEVA